MREKILQLKAQFSQDATAIKDQADLVALEIKYLGRKAGALTDILRRLKDLDATSRQEIGQLANQLKTEIEQKLSALKISLSGQAGERQLIDVTTPGLDFPNGHLHLVTQAIREITDIFQRIGFYRVRYPEVEWDWYAFESLNMPPDHPARDEWETFFIDLKPVGLKGQRILTPHSTSGTARELENQPPLRSINITKCYRRQIDVSHAPMFHQFDGLLVDTNVTIANLKGVLDYFVKEFFGPNRRARIRPFHFQFTEPSFEVDVSCGLCDGQGCKMCKACWHELGGSGMVHPSVLKAGGLDPKKYSGFAFGWGVERAYLMKAGLQIPDIRILYQSDLRFLNQF